MSRAVWRIHGGFLSEDVGVGFLRNLGPETGLGLRVTLQP